MVSLWIFNNFRVMQGYHVNSGINGEFSGRVDVELLLMNVCGFMKFYLFISVQICALELTERG